MRSEVEVIPESEYFSLDKMVHRLVSQHHYTVLDTQYHSEERGRADAYKERKENFWRKNVMIKSLRGFEYLITHSERAYHIYGIGGNRIHDVHVITSDEPIVSYSEQEAWDTYSDDSSDFSLGEHHTRVVHRIDSFLRDISLDLPRQTDSPIDEILAALPHIRPQDQELLIATLARCFNLRDMLDEGITSCPNGFTSMAGLSFGSDFLKIDQGSRLLREQLVYSIRLPEFDLFRPPFHALYMVDPRDPAILHLGNTNGLKPGSALAFQRFNFMGDYNDYNLWLMGIFHKEMAYFTGLFEHLPYTGFHGAPHFYEGFLPHINVSSEGYSRFKDSKIEEPSQKSIIADYLEAHKGFHPTVILGDWKPENMVNGYMVDFAMVGLGLEVDELAYFCSDIYKSSRLFLCNLPCKEFGC